jgi:hypothetical protein
MSQPVALIARITLSEAVFKKFLRSSSAEMLADCIVNILICDIHNYYIFRYLKKEQAVFAFFYFNYGSASSLASSSELQVLKALAEFSGKGASGYILAHLDAANLFPEEMAEAWCVIDGRCHHVDALNTEAWDQILNNSDRYFYKEVETDFSLNFSKKRIVDKTIVKKCMAIQEKNRIEKLASQLHLASIEQPLYFFGNYFYNGEFIYFCYQGVKLLREIDPASFVQTVYGAADATHVVVGGVIVSEDVANFKMLQKGEIVYYKDSCGVYNDSLELITGADSASFRLKTNYYAEDKDTLYFNNQKIPKSSLGEFKFHPAGYFFAQRLLIGKKAVFMGSTQLDVDPDSFCVLKVLGDGARSDYGDVAYYVKDCNGTYLLHCQRFETPFKARLIKTKDPEGLLKEVSVTPVSASFVDHPPELKPDSKTDIEAFRCWIATNHFERCYEEGKFDTYSRFYKAINNYFDVLYREGAYHEILGVYAKFHKTAWVNPYLFHRTACCYAVLGKTQEAISEVHKAVVYGYEHLDAIWKDPDLATIQADPRMLGYQEQGRDQTVSFISLELLEAMSALPSKYNKFVSDLVIRLSYRFRFPQSKDVHDAWRDAAEGRKKDRYMAYATHLQRLFRRQLHLQSFQFKEERFYRSYRQYEDLHPIVHLNALVYYFRGAHTGSSEVFPQDMKRFLESLSLLRRSMRANPEAVADPVFTDALGKKEYFAYLVQQAESEDE